TYYLTNCSYDFNSGNGQALRVTIDPADVIFEANDSNNNYNLSLDILQTSSFETYDQEDDSENKAAWLSEQETLPDQMTYFFANYTMDNSTLPVLDANCNITFNGGSEGGIFSFTYNSSSELYEYNRTFDNAGNYSWNVECGKTNYEYFSGSGSERVRIPIYNHTSHGFNTFAYGVNYYEDVNLSVELPAGDIDENSSGYNLSDVWVQISKPDTSVENYSLVGSSAGGIWNNSYVTPKQLGIYSLVWFANLTSGYDIIKLIESNFSVENLTISIALNSTLINVTDVIMVSGDVVTYNGTDYVNVSDNAVYTFQDDFANGTNNTDSAGHYIQLISSSTAGPHVAKVNVTDLKGITNENQSSFDVNIPLRDEASVGMTTGLWYINSIENVNISLEVPSEYIRSNYQLSSVWVQITKPDSSKTNISLSGNVSGGLWNLTYSDTSALGSYTVDYFANLSDGFSYIEDAHTNFTVEDTFITINAPSEANTTSFININGSIQRFNGTDYVAIPNNLFLIEIGGVLVSSNIVNDTSFTEGSGEGVNMSDVVELNLSLEHAAVVYSDNFSSDTYTTDSEVIDYNGEGYSSTDGTLFELDQMTLPIGNITYMFDSVTKFYNASIYINTASSQSDSGGNTSVWYSLDNSSWEMLDSSTSIGDVVGGVIPVSYETIFYVMVQSDTNGFNNENPISNLTITYSDYDYPSVGEYTSAAIYLPNITYTSLRWNENLGSSGDIELQIRESDNNVSWDSWSANYTNNLGNDIRTFTKSYIQYRAWLSTTNVSETPALLAAQILYFNASTDANGNYNYNITVPSDNLGTLPLNISIVQDPSSGIIGSNVTNIDVWAEMSSPYTVTRNYTTISNYTIDVNFTRLDTGALANGSIDIVIFNSTYSLNTSCSDTYHCSVSWLIPEDLRNGNYTINVSAYNESAYYRNMSASFAEYLEEEMTSGTLNVSTKYITDYHKGNPYQFYWNATINNTGNADMNNLTVYYSDIATDDVITDIEEAIPCTNVLAGEVCNATMLITIAPTADADSYFVSWKANWTDNNGSISGGLGEITYVDMYVVIVPNATLYVADTPLVNTIQHDSTGTSAINVQSVGSDSVLNIESVYVEQNTSVGNTLPASWVDIDPSLIGILPAANNYSVKVNVTVPVQTSPGNYSGYVNVTAETGGSFAVNITIIVPVNMSWYVDPSANFSFNDSFAINAPGFIGNYTIVNTGNVNFSMGVSYDDSGSIDYHDFGTQLFEENYDVDGLTTNPTSIDISKGGNTTINLYEKGRNVELLDVGVIFTMYNSSLSPSSLAMEDVFTIEEQPPAITGIWFIVNGEPVDYIEQSKNVTIKVRATDDVNLNQTGTTINLTWDGGSGFTQLVANPMIAPGQEDEYVTVSGKFIVLNYSVDYIPTTGGFVGDLYEAIATAYDINGDHVVSGQYNVTSYGIANLDLVENVSIINITGVDLNNGASVFINYTANNTGYVTAYNSNMTFSENENISVDGHIFGDIGYSSSESKNVMMNISAMTPPGLYDITAYVDWENPVGTHSSDSVVLTFNVTENKSFTTSTNALGISVPSGSSGSGVIVLSNTGNTELTNMNFECAVGDVCTDFTVEFNESDFDIGLNQSKAINVTVTAAVGKAAGNYVGNFFNITEDDIYKDVVELQVNVPETKTWYIDPTNVTVIRGVGSSGNLKEITISNTGNVNASFTISSTNSSLIYPNISAISIPLGSNGTFMIDYSLPEDIGVYLANITLTNADGGASPPGVILEVNITATGMNLIVMSPTNSSPLQNIESGDDIVAIVNATYDNVVLTDYIDFAIDIGDSSCAGLNSVFNSSAGYWNLSCIAPDVPNGLQYNLTATMSNDTYGLFSKVSENSVHYLDISPPLFVVYRNSIEKNNFINLLSNVTDNVNVSSVWFSLTYPNSTSYSSTMSSFGGLYNFTGLNLGDAGEYLVNYSANDTTGNINSTIDWFEVYDNYTWNVGFSDYKSDPISGINISMNRPSTFTTLMTNLTDSNGLASFIVNRRFYDISTLIGFNEMLIKNVNFSNASESNLTLNMHSIAGEDLEEVISLHKPFVGIASNSTGFGSNNVSAIFNYSGYNYDSAGSLGVVKCADWNYSKRKCDGVWSVLASSRDADNKKVQGNSTGFSAYFLAENKCGNGLCEVTYAETTSTCLVDCPEEGASTTTTTVISSGGGGGGSSGLSAGDLKKIEDIVSSFLDVGGVKIDNFN
ncbi:MAG: hypothetical protein OEL89_01485, partial [Candidatus Peregrinibacteria bacterium]|nr:hypothetical protein [Candidatus Peregrinibacteria bacterium]